MSRPKVFLEISIDGNIEGKVVFELFGDIVPKTAENFRALCTGEKGQSFKSISFDKVKKHGYAQAGKGFTSIYGEKFDDENFQVKHAEPYVLSMVNSGPNTNGTEFRILFQPNQEFDGKNVAFGIAVEGKDILDKLHNVAGSASGDLVKSAAIANCGQC